MTLKEQVEQLLPGWKRWYPSLFDAATDLGLLRARVCSPDSLLLTNRHSRVQRAAEEAHREQWGGGPEPEAENARSKRRRAAPRQRPGLRKL